MTDAIIAQESLNLFPEEMNIYTATQHKQFLLQLLSEQGPISLDLSSITEIDGTGLQLLISAKNEATSRRTLFEIKNCSPCVTEALSLCGLHDFFCNALLK